MHAKKIRFDKTHRGRLTRRAASALFVLLVASAPFCFGQSPAPQTFSSPEAASRALVAAVKADDDQAMMKILGGGKALVSLEDEVQDKAERERFVQKYQEMHRLVHEPDRTTVLYIGAENWPFPVPLVASRGAWHFDARTGMREVLYRRIGENETKVIEACHALAQSNREDDSAPDGETADSSLRDLLKTSTDSSAHQNGPVRSNGYYFRILDSKKNESGEGNTGISYVAYPLEYRKTGVMTFIVTDDDVVYQKDLGPNTEKLATSMTKYKPGSWRKAE